jgi:hypothetical protein
MLAPNVNDVLNLLTQAFNEILQIDGYAQTTDNILIGKLEDDPAWLASVRSRVAMLGQQGSSWVAAKPDIWAPILVQFSNYNSAIAAVAEMQSKGQLTTKDQWVRILNDMLLAKLSSAVTTTNAAATALKTHLQAFADIQPLLESSINEGWAALASEEQQMVQIAGQLTHLQDVVASLQDSITSSDISTGQSVVTTTVKTLYNIATEAGESFSFLSMVGSALTVGKFFYDVITSTDAVVDTLNRIAALQVKASEEAQAAAGTKMVLQLLYSLQLSFKSIVNTVPEISTMWSNEQDKVQDAIDALNAGADPSSLFDLQTLSIAATSWQTLSQFALAIPSLKSNMGPPVALNPQQPISSHS